MTSHVCRHPLWHRLGIVLATMGWLLLAIPFLGKSVYTLTGSGALALGALGSGCAFTILVRNVARWRCQIHVQPSHTYPLRSAVVATWALSHGDE